MIQEKCNIFLNLKPTLRQMLTTQKNTIYIAIYKFKQNN